MLGEKELENSGTCAEIEDSNTLHLLFGHLSLGISGLMSADPRRIWAPSTLELAATINEDNVQGFGSL